MEVNSPEMDVYFKNLKKGVDKEYIIANEARAKGFDPKKEVEIPLAMSLAEKVVGLISTMYPQVGDKKIVERILELEEEYGQLDTTISFKIAEEVAKQKFCKFDNLLEAIDAGIRVGFAYQTIAVVASPLEGYTGLKLGKTKEGKDYFIVNFSGPIRSAGTTASCVVLMIIDYLRECFGYAKYDPTEDEVKRYVTENHDHHERVNNLQYFPLDEEMEFLAKNLPIQIAGEPTAQRDVSNYKDLPRVDTNRIRGGMCLIFSEGLAQKGQKAFRLYKRAKEHGLVLSGFDFLADYIELHEKLTSSAAGEEKDNVPVYIKDIVAGRPVFGHPSRSGAFRFRYGRSRVCGFSAVSIHPATMAISNGFLASGTQLKIEKPTKGCIAMSCDSIEGPIVKLKNGDVKKLKDFYEAKKIYKDVEEIIYFGDLLFPLGDVMNRNAELVKPGYVEEWWKLELEEVLGEAKDFESLELKKIDEFSVGLEEAIRISKKYNLPLHPEHTFYWSQISKEALFWLLDWMQNASWRNRLVFPYSKSVMEKFSEAKRALEILGIEHEIVADNVVVKYGETLLVNLGLDKDKDLGEQVSKMIDFLKDKDEAVLNLVNQVSKFEIKDKAGDFVGSRMGRPEKAKLRKLIGSPNVLFPIGEQGGRFRSVGAAVEAEFIKADFPNYFCEKCEKETIYNKCEDCGGVPKLTKICPVCSKKTDEDICDCRGEEGVNTRKYSFRKIDSKHYFKKSLEHLGIERREVPELIKGIKRTSSTDRDFENLAKGILRSKYNVHVNKDGTIRYDATEMPVSHFYPSEIGISVDKLQEQGYVKDINGKELVSENQLLELKPHDIILPSCPDTKDERADDLFANIANFVDELLEKFYKLPRHYNIKSREDLVGQLVVCMAPHNCAGVIGRIIGFSKNQGLMASPFIHAAMRRDCDGDEAAVMLLMDVLINFSRKFLPAHRGGTQDAPLVLNAHIRAGEVDDQILDFETCWNYPLDLYRKAEEGKHSSEVEIETVKTRLAKGECPFTNIGFTHKSSDFNLGITNSSYKFLPTMKDKVREQMDLVVKLRAADSGDVARLVVDRHFIRDIRGNLRKFSQQQFRCVKCNEKFRRPPMVGVCTKCQGKIIFTISEGSIKKYLEPAIELAENFDIPEYTKQGLELTKVYIESIFGRDAEKQEELKKWF